MLFIFNSCSGSLHGQNEKGIAIQHFDYSTLKQYVGKKITVTGKAQNLKIGARLVCDNGTIIWMDDIDSWPAGYYLGEDDSKTVRVAGKLIEKNDLPIVGDNKGDLKIQGMSVPEGANEKEINHRYLLKDASWEVIEE